MKKKIRIINKITGDISEKEYTVRNIFHAEVSKNFHSQVFKDKTKYTRKEKHKKDLDIL